MLMASGLNIGFRRGLPHLWRVALGFGAMVLAVGMGLDAVFEAFPLIHVGLKFGGRSTFAISPGRSPRRTPVAPRLGQRAPDYVFAEGSLSVVEPQGLGDGRGCCFPPMQRSPDFPSICS
jgi:hypothetical protein